jgi:NAD(P)-dependent dehydrogenase (short-subunit alcohol dehydrogenase family)
MTRAVVPHMRRQVQGRIVNIGSVLGFLPMPYGALYAATKHADRGLFRVARPRAAHAGHPGLGDRARLHEDAVRRELPASPTPSSTSIARLRAAVGQAREGGDGHGGPAGVVAGVVLKAARCRSPDDSATRPAAWRAGSGSCASSAPAGLVDAGIRRDLRLDRTLAWKTS